MTVEEIITNLVTKINDIQTLRMSLLSELSEALLRLGTAEQMITDGQEAKKLSIEDIVRLKQEIEAHNIEEQNYKVQLKQLQNMLIQ